MTQFERVNKFDKAHATSGVSRLLRFFVLLIASTVSLPLTNVFALGAEAVQMGTAFLACEESGASPIHREALLQRKAGHTALTKAFTGRLARGIQNRFMNELNQKGAEILPYPLQRVLVRNLSIAAEAAGRADLLPLWAGQSANLSSCTDVSVFLNSLVEEVSEIASPVTEWSAKRRHEQK
jgi:nitronate monooxygenase